MIYLLAVSFIWAFSFGLIKGILTGINPVLVSFIRLSISLLVFLPFLRVKRINFRQSITLALIGAIQFGIMYVSYISAYKYLLAWQIALFTIFTPIYVTIINDIYKKKFSIIPLIAAVLSILGTLIIMFKTGKSAPFLKGFALVQISNISFAWGQIAYKKLNLPENFKQVNAFAMSYLGAVVLTGLFTALTVDFASVSFSVKQIVTLLYLGSIASGLCFFLWNYGAKKTGIGYLAVMNNLKIPLAVLCSLIFWHEEANIIRLLLGSIVIGSAMILNKYDKSRNKHKDS